MLEVKNLNAWWGAAQALFDVSLRVNAGELVVLKGLNGAGKSTLLQAIVDCGPRITGVISYQNKLVNASPAHQRAQAGLGYVAEDRRLFATLSVRENLHIAARGQVARNEAQVFALFRSVPGQPAEVALAIDDDRLHLPQLRSASGARYGDSTTTFWNKGDSATFTRRGTTTTCHVVK